MGAHNGTHTSSVLAVDATVFNLKNDEPMKRMNLFAAHGRAFLCCSAFALFLLVCGIARAQTVSISPATGHVVSALSYNEESHILNYGGAWIHNQLPLTLLTSDEATLTNAGLVKVHANNVGVENGKLGLISGHGTIKNHMTLSLPKGYRFTGYKIVLNYESWHADDDAVATTFRETQRDFSTDITKVDVGMNAKKVTLSRTSLNSGDMGNILYFLQDHSKGHATVSVESFVITFECTDPFSEALHPADANLSQGVSCVALPFHTERADLGSITQETKNGYTSYKYDYQNVKDLKANFLFYDEKGIQAGSAVAGAKGDGSISAIATDGENSYLGVKNNTYWLEVPTDALAQDGNTLPVGYRIVGASVRYGNNKSDALFVKSGVKKGSDIYISDGNGRYMNTNLQFTTTKVLWHFDTDGKVFAQNGNKTVYLKDYYELLYKHTLSTTTKAKDASSFDTEGGNLYYITSKLHNKLVISYGSDGKGCYNNVENAIVANAFSLSSTPSNTSFTLKLYDKTGESVVDEAHVNADNPSGELSVDGLNNDAVKLQVEGLKNGELAYLAVEVKLEALNPYIDKMDISCTQPSGEKKLKNQYLADDFTIGTGGKVNFAVPTNFGTTGLRFTFEGLHSKSADETYEGGTPGKKSRYHFVKSAYYDLIGENLQAHRKEAANYDYKTKVAVSVAGDMAFYCNNADKFHAGTTGDGTFHYEEYRYTNAQYARQGGQWKEMTVNSGDDYVKRYLIVCDETRYNIAPTTTPRHAYYAYYSTDLKLSTVDYQPVLTYKKVYNDAVIPSGPDNNHYVGVSVSLTDTDDKPLAEGVGYVYAKQIVEQINMDIQAKKKENVPVDANHILYFDASKVNSLLYSATDKTWGNLDDLQAVLGQNAMIFLPKGVTASLDNVASRSSSGDDFVAENNIVLTDQQPFFSPYDIRVNAANEVSYKRRVTHNNNTKKWVSLVLPFTVAVNAETGTYEQPSDKSKFTFFRMNPTNSFSASKNGNLTFSEIKAHFSPFTGAKTTQPNEAYVVRVDQAEAGKDESTLMFVVRQKGATIVKTPVTVDKPLIEGESSTGTVNGKQMTLVNQATYAGANVPVTDGIFYFNNDKFVSSLNVVNDYKTIKVLPFRSYYTCDGLANSVRFIYISTEPNNDPTGIDEVTGDAPSSDFDLSAQAGWLQVKANKDMRVNIRNLSGQTVDTAFLRAGETRTVDLPRGIYVVNGVKVAVN